MAPKTITVKGNPVRGEKIAAAAITPGHLCEFLTAGTIAKQATAAVNCLRMFALENSLIGDEIGTDYAVSAQVQYGIFGSGDEVYAWLSDGESVVIGDELEAGTTDGELIKLASGQPIAVAKAAVDLSASANTAKGRVIAIII
ncbi:MAG: hypothetical protein HOG49_30945 [Candidatus Scalindua sp.]|jgi:hypothetical protein|nr:hypothetical protein [Candidatus Scalindua sp.]